MKKDTEIHHESKNGGGEGEEIEPLPLMSLNHVSRLCKSVEDSMDFYEKIMGFVPMKRPGAFNFGGACPLIPIQIRIHLQDIASSGH
uniref:Glyoxalase/fosfomycin resistance/dioxygenase domain-containing protein n=1 Tax=Picea sitchensis TaxID=3332 RepID=A9NYZ9_PICSI|nr:unknown [Picea sitchensis]